MSRSTLPLNAVCARGVAQCSCPACLLKFGLKIRPRMVISSRTLVSPVTPIVVFLHPLFYFPTLKANLTAPWNRRTNPQRRAINKLGTIRGLFLVSHHTLLVMLAMWCFAETRSFQTTYIRVTLRCRTCILCCFGLMSASEGRRSGHLPDTLLRPKDLKSNSDP